MALQYSNAISPLNNNLAIGSSIATDSTGNVFVLGSFLGSITFNQTLSSPNNSTSALYIAKLSPDLSTYLASISVGSPGVQIALASIYLDSSNNVYISGYYSGGSLTFGATTLPSSNTPTSFVAAIDDDLQTWISATSTSGNSEPFVLTGSGSDLYLAGFFSGTCTFGNQPLTAVGGPNSFLAILQLSNGSLSWNSAYAITGYNNYISSLSVNYPNLYSTGRFGNTITFNPNLQVSSSNPNSVFIAQFDLSQNTFVSAIAPSSNSVNFSSAKPVITNDLNGNIYVGVNYVGTVNFSGYQVSSTSIQDVFILSLDADLNPTGLTTTSEYTSSCSVSVSGISSNDGNVLVYGTYRRGFYYGTQAFPPISSTGPNQFVLQLSPYLNLTSYLTGGGTSGATNTFGGTVNNNLYLTGDFSNTVAFGNYHIITSTTGDTFIVSISW